MDSPYSRELEVAFRALQNAARLSQHIIASADKGVVEKADLSPVTIADFAIQALLTATFQDAFPGDRFVGEEDAAALRQNLVLLERVWELLLWVRATEDAAALCKLPRSREQMCDLIDQCGASKPGASGRTWVFDPIDGTKTYVRSELYAINIGLLVDGRQAVGAVGCPNLSINAVAPLRNEDVDPEGEGCIVFAAKGFGAYVRTMSGADVEARRLPPLSSDLALSDVRLVSCIRHVDSGLNVVHEAVAARLGMPFPGCDLVPWVLRWAVLAMGRGSATVWVYNRRRRYGKAWDHAGAMLLFEETGGKITDVHGRAIDLAVGRKMTANFGFVAAPRHLHAEVLAAVRAVLKEQGRKGLLDDS